MSNWDGIAICKVDIPLFGRSDVYRSINYLETLVYTIHCDTDSTRSKRIKRRWNFYRRALFIRRESREVNARKVSVTLKVNQVCVLGVPSLSLCAMSSRQSRDACLIDENLIDVDIVTQLIPKISVINFPGQNVLESSCICSTFVLKFVLWLKYGRLTLSSKVDIKL